MLVVVLQTCSVQQLTAAALLIQRHVQVKSGLSSQLSLLSHACRVQDAQPQQQQPLQQPTALHSAHQQQQPGQKQQPHLTQQQLQQYWLQAQGVQQSMDDLASYVDHMASASAKSALSLQQATWQEKQQLESIVKQQSARLQQQAAELEVLRGLARQQGMQQQLQQPAQQESAQDSRLQRQLEFHRQVRRLTSTFLLTVAFCGSCWQLVPHVGLSNPMCWGKLQYQQCTASTAKCSSDCWCVCLTHQSTSFATSGCAGDCSMVHQVQQ